MELKLIKTEKEYKLAMARLEELFDSVPGTEHGDEFEVLSLLVEKYEEVIFPIETPKHKEAIKFRKEQLDTHA
jgi:HTH-type transcriptional regulator / antitoxin HigA